MNAPGGENADNPRPHTSLGLARQSEMLGRQSLEGAFDYSQQGLTSVMIDTGSTGSFANLNVLRASWARSGAGSTESLEEPPDLKASRYKPCDDVCFHTGYFPIVVQSVGLS